MHQRTKISAAVVLALGGLTNVAYAQAQSQPQQIERVEVTGSRIRQIDTETSQPILKLTAEDIAKSGLVTVGDIVNQISSAGSPAFSKGSVLTSNREQGGQYINMRNLGAQRVLVLVNGRRWSQSVGGFTDLSTIPASMIERMEVLKDGASSLYGSDAIAGVINFILKKSLDGGEASVYYGANEKGDGASKEVALSFGANSEKASAMIGITYNKVDPVWAKDREITSFSYTRDHYTANLISGPWGRLRLVNPTTGGALSGNATRPDIMINHSGTYDGVGTAGGATNNRANYHTYAGAETDLFNATQQMMFTMPAELKSVFSKGSVDISQNVRFNATTMYAERSSTRQVAGMPFNSQSQPGYPVYLDKDSAFNPYGNQGVGVAPGTGVDMFVVRRTIELPRIVSNNNRTLHADAGVEGDFDLFGRAWNWSTAINYSKVSGDTLSSGNLNLVNLKKAIGPSFRDPATGQVRCGTPAAPIGDCVPFDIVGGPSNSTAAALAYVNHQGVASYGSTIRSLNADISGEIVKLPGGMMGFAAGLEKRNVSGFDRPGAMEQANLTTDLAARTTTGAYEVDEAYVELNVPLLKGLPGVESLSLNLASRYSDYSNFGDTTNSKASLTYRPIKDLLVRATWAEGFRAPTLGDVFGGGSQTFDSYLDPCDTLYGAYATDATVRARCTAAGVPAGFRQLNAAGAPVAQGGGQTPYPFQSGAGNEFLTPETAVTKTAGLVFNPSFLPGLNLALDWYKIQVDNRITAVGTPFLLNQCYVQGVTQVCGLHTRDATGQVNTLRRGNANLGSLKTEGFDVAIGYKFPAQPWGKLNLRTESTYVKSFKTQASAGANWVEWTGDAFGFAHYRFKSNITLDWSLGDWGASLLTRYYSAFRAACWDTGAPASGSTPARPPVECSNPTDNFSTVGTGFNRMSAQVYNDLSVTYKTPWKGTVRVGSNNIFDVKPRVNYSAASGFGGPSAASSVDPDLPIDRSFYIRYTQQF